ncbi:MAG: hypothetical protein CO145_01445 [Candidatus Nealsonbacteria bacterium CG_4_9_14_3_um_filter_37_13]|uniref:Uncharacterized protein n=1 Tax=Candidatus Nealsonbacteria bacterium CG_4_9_14_3_um_filter_37_13 TaxID=1974695 RepID=A0A2M7Z5A3_9BACT|nr:MAG: hypothetical protein CO145_01445 [Candidatus Nealsonbacteria bacterium CG_4_9_14_3_um_filter_37_13]
METQSDGSFCFHENGKPIFIFHKKNYDFHCSKHPLLKEKWFSDEVEKTLLYPDVITQGLLKKIRIYYKVIKSHNAKYNIWVNVIRIPLVFRHNKEGKIICFIKSVHDRWGFSDQIIHTIEKRIWENPKSLI